jgi:molybdopterin-containing oxidoreductase family iron-sulfur binding subunit
MKPRSENEFLEGASEWHDSLSRRDFLALAGASLALAGLSGCTRPPHDPILPYVTRPEDSVPGRPEFYATACTMNGLATGILLETHEGRPTKVEGNPDHPASLGAAFSWQQARILGLYDPDRAKEVLFQNKKSSWAEFQRAWKIQNQKLQQSQGAGFVVFSEPTSSPTLIRQMTELRAKYPKMRWVQWSPLMHTGARDASLQTFGSDLSPIYDFSEAEVVVSLNADFLAGYAYPVSYARQFMQRRRATDHGKHANTLFVAENGLSLTGLKANQRLALSSAQLQNFAKDLFFALEPNAGNVTSKDTVTADVRKLAAMISRNAGHCAFLAGDEQPAEVHAICHGLNRRFGEKAVRWIANPVPAFDSDLASLAKDLEGDKIQALWIVGPNPLLTLPLGLDWAKLIRKTPFQACMASHENETSEACDWFLPLSDDFEAWSDSKSFDGSVSILQPAISPLYDTRNFHEQVHFATYLEEKTSYEIMQASWKKIWGNDFPKRWSKALRTGIVADSAASAIHPKSKPLALKPRLSESTSAIEVFFKPDSVLLDGRFANNAWLQELPDPLTQITWDNVAAVSDEIAREKNISNGQVLEIQVADKKLNIPAWALKGLPKNVVVINLGYGRTRCGKVGNNVGVNTFTLKSSDAAFVPAKMRVTSEFRDLACAQTHQQMEDRSPVKTTKDLTDVARSAATSADAAATRSLYPNTPVSDAFTKAAWSMTIDLDSCTGCSACVIACQSENNIPVVGKSGVLAGREMHWIRVDRYDDGKFQPVPCMHCEKAPCEPVCPVGATVHGDGGLNQMVYNRCVGTRYCASNCPYKIRRFNFLNFTKFSEVEKLQKNPDVTIRTRGVMEKCTYCVQRINQAQIQAKVEDRTLKDGEIQTACQQTCPTKAIVFGDQNDPASQVSLLKRNRRNYSLLEELGTRPRTTYLAQLSEEDLHG